MNNPVITALTQFFEDYQTIWQKSGYPCQPYDEQWLSPCQMGEAQHDEIKWQPVARVPTADFKNIEQAMELTLHPDINPFYGHFYSDSLDAKFDDHLITLIQPWNSDDFERLQQNMIHHLMMQQRLKQPATLFLATTDDDMELISLKNDTGEVIVEKLGVGEVSVLAPDLAQFISKLIPIT